MISQEWKNLKSYQKETGNSKLHDGCWLKINRKNNDDVWKKVNLFNLSIDNGNVKYQTISQIRDFYIWFDAEREKQGHEIKWIGITVTVTDQLSKLDCGFIRSFIVSDQEVLFFANEGSKKVFEFAFSQLRAVYFSKELIKGEAANLWDSEYGMKEQCLVLEPLYQKLSKRALRKLDRMAKGKGIFALAVPKELKYVGSIEDCKVRFEHGINKVLPFNLSVKEKKN